MRVVGRTECHVYPRMRIFLEKDVGFTQVHEDFYFEIFSHTSNVQVVIAQTGDMHAPLSATVVRLGIVRGTAHTADDLSLIVNQIFDSMEEA